MLTSEAVPQTPDIEELFSDSQYRIYDYLLATTLALCLIIGLPGNIASFVYFYSTVKKDFASLIYTMVCGIDVCSCVVHVPVTIALYNGRRAGLFADKLFCVSWSVLFYFLQRMSMFLVMLMSVSRSVKIVFIHYKIKRNLLIISFIVYTFFIAIWEVLIVIFGGKNMFYSYNSIDAYCYYEIEGRPFSYIDQLISAFTIGIPPIITTISFTVFIIRLKMSTKGQNLKRNNQKHHAAVTMTLFTSLFLVCNFPCLLNNILWFLTKLPGKYSVEVVYQNKFMFFYGWLIGDIVCTVVNAALNPVLYLLRKKKFRRWSTTSIRRLSVVIRTDETQLR